MRTLHVALLLVLGLATAPKAVAQNAPPPSGFIALFNGKNLAGWGGGSTFDPRKLDAMPAAERQAQVAKWTASMREHWRAENGELVNDGNGDYATTESDYGDFELLVEYKTVPKADSGIYLRGCPQVQIWDSTDRTKFNVGADKGSGGLWNNSPGAPGKDPLVRADRPFGQWNKLRIVMTGARVSVWLNDELVVKYAVLENYFDRQAAVPVRGPIQLQTHGGEIRWRNLFLREIGAEEASRLSREQSGAGAGPQMASIASDPNQPRIEVLRDQAPNAFQWALAPLEQPVPADIRQNLTFLLEDLRDESSRSPKAPPAAYERGDQLCRAIIGVLDERRQTLAAAGFRAVEANARTGASSQALEARRNYKMSWPQDAREESQRAELKSQAASDAEILKERPKLEWVQRTAIRQQQFDALYAQFRDALRQSK
jgi:hypothetical protein